MNFNNLPGTPNRTFPVHYKFKAPSSVPIPYIEGAEEVVAGKVCVIVFPAHGDRFEALRREDDKVFYEVHEGDYIGVYEPTEIAEIWAHPYLIVEINQNHVVAVPTY